jgi:imidazolonepropionase-like amidohydrolase
MTYSKNTSVLFSNGQNKAIADFSKLQNKKTIILKGKGKFLMPGLAEMHSHLPIDSKIDTLLLMLQQA